MRGNKANKSDGPRETDDTGDHQTYYSHGINSDTFHVYAQASCRIMPAIVLFFAPISFNTAISFILLIVMV